MAAKVEGLQRVLDQLDRRSRAARTKARCVVGFSAPYAIYVHENLQARHPTGQAKFLEQPARMHAKDIRRVVARALRSGTPLNSALALGGIHLSKLAVALAPIDTGALRQSVYVTVLNK